MSLEELMAVRIDTVYSASKYEQKVTRAPASVTIVTAEEIARFGHRTLGDILRSVRGVYVSNDRNYSYFGVRGFLRPGDYNSRVLVLIDGHRLNDNIYDGAYFGRDGLPVEVIERIEFVRGPSSSIYGSSAFFGIVNVITKRASDIGGLQLAAGGGSFDQYDGRVTYGGVLGGDTEVTFSTSYYNSGGNRRLYYPEFDPAVSDDPRAADGGIARDLDGEESYNISASARRGDFAVSTMFISRTKDVPTASFNNVFNAPLYTTDTRGFLDLKYEHAFDPDFQIAGRLTYDRYGYRGHYESPREEVIAEPGNVVSIDEALGTWVGTEWQLTRRLLGRHTLIAGFEYRQSLRERQRDSMDLPPLIYDVNVDGNARNSAFYAQGEFALTSKWLLNGGVRYDYYSNSFGGTVNPRVSLIYTPREGSTLKLIYGEAFRAPSAYERLYYPAPPGSNALQPETVSTYEIALEKYLGERDRVDLSIYHYEVNRLITQQTDAEHNVYFANLARVTADGIELEVERRLEGGGLVRMSYALQRTEDPATGRTLTNSPRHLAKFNAGLPIRGVLDTGIELQYEGPVETLAGRRAGGFLLTNLTLASAEAWRGFRVTAGLYNLFDVRYAYPGAADHVQDVIMQDGRTVHIGLERRL